MSAVHKGSFVESESGESGGLSDSIRENTTITALGKTKTFAGLEKNEWIFVTISTINILIAIGLTIERLVDLKKDSPDFTFAIIMLINTVFCLFYAIHGVLREREFEVYAYIAATIVLFIYIVMDLAINSKQQTDIKWVRFGALLGLGIPNIFYGYKVATGFGYLEFKTVGAAVALQKLYRQAGLFSVLLKFDLQLAVSLLVLVISNVTDVSTQGIVVVGVGVPVQLSWTLLGWIIMRRELQRFIWIFVACSLVEPGYIVLRLYQLIDEWDKNTTHDKSILTYTFLGGAAVALVIRVLVIVSLKFVVNNFGKGLRELVFALPLSDDQPPLLPRKRDIAKCCGIVCCGPLG